MVSLVYRREITDNRFAVFLFIKEKRFILRKYEAFNVIILRELNF